MSADAEFGYTLATGKLFADFADFHEWCELLIQRPILTHEFASEALWDEMRLTFETRILEHAAS